MSPTRVTYMLCSVLAGGAAISLIAATATDLWAGADTIPPGVSEVALGTVTPRVQIQPGSSQAPSPKSAAPVRPPGKGFATEGADDLSRLRSRELVIPVSAISAAQLIDTYTQPRSGGSAHEALDIMAPRGTPVLAVDDGRVTKLFFSSPGGITLYQFDPGAEYVYYYAHLDRYAEGISEGAAVLKGQVIGYVGSTGNARPDAPHLHFAVLRLGAERNWWRGAPINPFLIWRSVKP